MAFMQNITDKTFKTYSDYVNYVNSDKLTTKERLRKKFSKYVNIYEYQYEVAYRYGRALANKFKDKKRGILLSKRRKNSSLLDFLKDQRFTDKVINSFSSYSNGDKKIRIKDLWDRNQTKLIIMSDLRYDMPYEEKEKIWFCDDIVQEIRNWNRLFDFIEDDEWININDEINLEQLAEYFKTNIETAFKISKNKNFPHPIRNESKDIVWKIRDIEEYIVSLLDKYTKNKNLKRERSHTTKGNFTIKDITALLEISRYKFDKLRKNNEFIEPILKKQRYSGMLLEFDPVLVKKWFNDNWNNKNIEFTFHPQLKNGIKEITKLT